MYQYFVQYYSLYGPLLLFITIVLSSFYWIVASWYGILSTYHCISLKNVVTGNVYKCFSDRPGETCQNTEVGYTLGWCNDPDHYGAHPGTRAGPYGFSCNQWTWTQKSCPPAVCAGEFPKGIGSQDPQLWGWCADEGVDRAMIGAPCGPREGSCNNWVWDVKKCPTGCIKAPPVKVTKKKPKQCMCTRKTNPWAPYENRAIRVSTVSMAATVDSETKEQCAMASDATVGEETTAGSKSTKFRCTDGVETPIKGDPMTLEKSTDGRYRIINSDGCAMKWSQTKGGNKALGSDERAAYFDCNGHSGDPLELEGSPDDVGFYANIENRRCGLQWSSIKGNAPGVKSTERLAKFDCNDKADRFKVTLA